MLVDLTKYIDYLDTHLEQTEISKYDDYQYISLDVFPISNMRADFLQLANQPYLDYDITELLSNLFPESIPPDQIFQYIARVYQDSLSFYSGVNRSAAVIERERIVACLLHHPTCSLSTVELNKLFKHYSDNFSSFRYSYFTCLRWIMEPQHYSRQLLIFSLLIHPIMHSSVKRADRWSVPMLTNLINEILVCSAFIGHGPYALSVELQTTLTQSIVKNPNFLNIGYFCFEYHKGCGNFIDFALTNRYLGVMFAVLVDSHLSLDEVLEFIANKFDCFQGNRLPHEPFVLSRLKRYGLNDQIDLFVGKLVRKPEISQLTISSCNILLRLLKRTFYAKQAPDSIPSLLHIASQGNRMLVLSTYIRAFLQLRMLDPQGRCWAILLNMWHAVFLTTHLVIVS